MSATDLAKSYDPRVEEPKVRECWQKAKPFRVNLDAPGDPYSIVIPPPNVTAPLHLGHALNNSLQDILIRYHRMRGCKTLWMPGTDHAGIATQTVVEKRLLETEGRKRTDFERDEFIARVQEWKDIYEADITDQLQLMGCSCDWDRQRFTMDDMCARSVREAFFKLFKDGLIYRGKRLVNWDPATQTALADDEVENEEVDGYFWYLKYPVVDDDGKETGEFVTVATTRPETMLGDTAVAVNPNDTTRQQLIGKQVRLPIVNRVISIIGDDYVVLPDAASSDPKAQYASGFLKVTPAHDTNDWEIGLRHCLDVINVMAPDGTISRDFGWKAVEPNLEPHEFLGSVLGLDRYEARESIVNWFRENDLLENVKPYSHSVGHSYRSHVAVEPYLSDQWYVRVRDHRLRGAALNAMVDDQRGEIDEACGYELNEDARKHRELISNAGVTKTDDTPSGEADWCGQLRFYPERYAKTFKHWHENLRDWCISRQLWWGHQIPVWSRSSRLSESKGIEVLAEITEKVHGWSLQKRIAVQFRGEFHELEATELTDQSIPAGFFCIRDPKGADREIVEYLEGYGFQQDPDVLDTWFSSALWPISTMGWPDPEAYPNEIPEGSALLETFNPTNVLTTAREIITLWVSRMVMFNTYFQNRLPFTDVFIHAMIQDGEGRKMSKSLGNGVDPRDIIKSKGTDAMRFTLTQMTTQTQDVRMPVEFDAELDANTSPKFEVGRRLCNKLWNATRFALSTLSRVEEGEGSGDSTATPIRLIDRWILSRLARTVAECEGALREYQFSVYAQTFYDLFWRDFCDWYLEGIKGTVRDDAAQQSVLRAVLGALHRVAHPIMPFITETLHSSIEVLAVQPLASIQLPTSELASTSAWPICAETLIDRAAEEEFEAVRGLIAALREVRSRQNVPDRRQITLHVNGDATAAQITAAEGVVEIMAGLELVTRDAPTGNAITVSVAGVEHALSNLAEAVDTAAEQERLSKRMDELAKQIGNLNGRLGNKNYVDKAPGHLVDETKRQLSEAEAELAGITEALDEVKG